MKITPYMIVSLLFLGAPGWVLFWAERFYDTFTHPGMALLGTVISAVAFAVALIMFLDAWQTAQNAKETDE